MNHPTWIDEYITASHKAFLNMIPSHWGSANFFQLLTFLRGSFIEKVHEAVVRLHDLGVAPKEATVLFSNPSTLRISMYWIVVEYQLSDHSKKNEVRMVLDYLVAILVEMTTDDLFGHTTNRIHTKDELDTLLTGYHFTRGTETIARELGRLFNSLSALSFALYRDMFPQEASEAYGPYDVSHLYGLQTILVIKDFSKLYVPELWPYVPRVCERMQLLHVLKNVEFSCELIGMHSRYNGDVINGLHVYAVLKDGIQLTSLEEIKKTRLEIERAVLQQFSAYNDFLNRDWVRQLLTWECFQFNKFFKKAGMDWHPTDHMLKNTENAVLDIGFGFETFPKTIEQYKSDQNYDAYWLLELYK